MVCEMSYNRLYIPRHGLPITGMVPSWFCFENQYKGTKKHETVHHIWFWCSFVVDADVHIVWVGVLLREKVIFSFTFTVLAFWSVHLLEQEAHTQVNNSATKSDMTMLQLLKYIATIMQFVLIWTMGRDTAKTWKSRVYVMIKMEFVCFLFWQIIFK